VYMGLIRKGSRQSLLPVPIPGQAALREKQALASRQRMWVLWG